jgi:hypothetical protein
VPCNLASFTTRSWRSSSMMRGLLEVELRPNRISATATASPCFLGGVDTVENLELTDLMSVGRRVRR